eukprot:TRINITY_DN55462_c0_g1_i1.p2 TRINITY_DN55462_c0_g1~~TRINITY_DN55462_c0_g1_i1.p2  ORF type:complete len:393 (+),score=147.75 TRINITY_DN55462_c0_g1_i1:94-1179(+)
MAEGRCRVGIVGTGWGINVQLPVFRAAGMEVTAVYSRSMDKARQLAEKHKIPLAFDSVEKLCASPEVDLVTVTSPTFLHVEHAATALRAGRHVLCDKPVAVSPQSAAELRDESGRRPKQICVVDHELRFLDAVRAAREAVQGGKIGEVRHVDALLHADFKGFGQVHGWWHQRESGGGASGAVGVHVIDLMHFVLGQRVARLSATERIFSPTRKASRGSQETRKVTADDMFAFTGDLAGGGAVSCSVSGCRPGPARRQLSVAGSKGSLLLDFSAVPTLTIYNAKGKKIEEFKEKKTAPDAFIIGTAKLAAALRSAVGGDASALSAASTLADGVYTQAVVAAVHKSADAGGAPQSVDAPAAKL